MSDQGDLIDPEPGELRPDFQFGEETSAGVAQCQLYASRQQEGGEHDEQGDEAAGLTRPRQTLRPEASPKGGSQRQDRAGRRRWARPPPDPRRRSYLLQLASS